MEANTASDFLRWLTAFLMNADFKPSGFSEILTLFCQERKPYSREEFWIEIHKGLN
jgi:hypothetical protein